ncbi:MAG: hypothetical protein K6E59_05285 [Bacilli bacterium]|nr:hypothetical protein [Bacilli bacterium]
MDKEKISSMAKAMKWVPSVLGILAILLAGFCLLLKMEDAQEKTNIMLFALLALFGVGMIAFGMGFSAVLDALALQSDKKEADDDADLDILA